MAQADIEYRKTRSCPSTPLSMQASAEDLFGQPFVSFAVDIPDTGKYAVEMEAFRGPDQGRVQMFRNENPAGMPADLFAEKQQTGQSLPMGVLSLSAGNNNLFLKIVSKNSNASGSRFEPISVVFRRFE